MSAVPPDELVRLWASERITPEHAIGQLVQQLARLTAMLDVQRQALVQVQGELASLRAGTPGPTGGRTTNNGRRTNAEGRKR